MIYPKFLEEGDSIGITAPSDGISKEILQKRLEYAEENLHKEGFTIVETENVRKSEKGRSSSAKTRARELEYLYQNPSVKAIICAGGGDFLLEILPHINFDTIQKNPKWIQGYSDPTALLYFITTAFDIATIYGNTIKVFGMDPWHLSLKQNLDFLRGKKVLQKSFLQYEKGGVSYITGKEPYHLDTDVSWKIITGERKVKIEGRMIGGCLDSLSDLFGTSFDKTKYFIEKYKEDGILFYFDNAELTCEQVSRTLWKFKEKGWFCHCNGILFGRSMVDKSYYDVSLEETILSSLQDLQIPVIMDVDLGHIPPRMTMINGALASVICEKGRGEVSFELS